MQPTKKPISGIKAGVKTCLPHRFHHRVAVCVSTWVGVCLMGAFLWTHQADFLGSTLEPWWQALIGVGIVASTYLLVAWRLRSLEPLRNALQQAARGNLECRVPVDQAPTTPFGHHFNQCMNQLSEARAQLEAEVRERRRTEAALRENKQLFDAFMRYLPALAYMKDEHGRYLYFNAACLTFFNQSPMERIGKTDHDLWSEDIAVELERNDQRVLIEGEALNTVEMVSLDNEVRYYRVSKFPILRHDKTPLLAGIAFDITDKIQAENACSQLEAQLMQSQKMEAIGTLAGGIAHDFNNILSGIMGYVELAQLSLDPGEAAHNRLEQVLKGTNRAKELVRQILTFSRKDAPLKKRLELTGVVEEALKLLRATLPTSIRIQFDMATRNNIILGDPTQIHQVVMNLCANAAHAMEAEGGELRISLDNVSVDSEMIGLAIPVSGEMVRLRVTDTGHGMDVEVLKRIFDPFYTTKETGRGTGMGLAVVHGIVKNHGGTIAVTSEVGGGACFDVRFPIVNLPMAMDDGAKTDLPRGSESILFVDDEIFLADLGKDMLKQMGYKVDARSSSVEALAALHANKGRYDLLITDMTMPDLTGDELATRALKLYPDLPVIICTGYSERIDKERAALIGARELLLKPLSIHKLATTVRRVLDLISPAGIQVAS
jgi:PAS domain S-box-containing protein